MNISITLQEQNIIAIYSVEQEAINTFNLRLVSFEGEKNLPMYLKIHRSEMGWISAFQDTVLVNALGLAIEKSKQNKQ